VIALAIRPWRPNAAVTALRAAFPGAKVHIRHYDPRAGFADFAVSQAITITDARELLTMTTSWGPGGCASRLRSSTPASTKPPSRR
jgi:hypothetical protein